MMRSEYGKWFYVILCGAKLVKAKGTKGLHSTQQLIIKKWRYSSFSEAWESAERTKKLELTSGDSWQTDIRIEILPGVPETNGLYDKISGRFKKMLIPHFDKYFTLFTQSEAWVYRHGGSDADVMMRTANFFLSFTGESNDLCDLDKFRISCPECEYWVNDEDLLSMMRYSVIDFFIEKLGEEKILVETFQVGEGAGF